MLSLSRYEDQLIRINGEVMKVEFISQDFIRVSFRGSGYKLWIGDYVDIGPLRVSLSDINGKQARLGFEGPRDVEVWREEVYKRMI
jgi:sRNA-binding carbon storage regulator CsrA